MIFSAALHENGTAAGVEAIVAAEAAGVSGVWLTSAAGDALVTFAAASQKTSRIRFGTAIIPIFPRHPLLLAQQAAGLAQLAPGRLRLGVGASHEGPTRDWHGLPYRRPLGHLREVTAILRQAFTRGQVDFEGEFYRCQLPRADQAEVPILNAACPTHSGSTSALP